MLLFGSEVLFLKQNLICWARLTCANARIIATSLGLRGHPTAFLLRSILFSSDLLQQQKTECLLNFRASPLPGGLGGSFQPGRTEVGEFREKGLSHRFPFGTGRAKLVAGAGSRRGWGNGSSIGHGLHLWRSHWWMNIHLPQFCEVHQGTGF